jgi:succinate dehydrogenase/fumarate reductase flavoprotein subunit
MPSKKADVSRREFLTTTAAGVTAAALVPGTAHTQESDIEWDMSADFVSIGAGVAGLAGGLTALEHGASVILVDENHDIGGHGMISGGLVHLGGGNEVQRMHGIEDSADMVYEDWIRPDHPLARYNDRDLVRVYADETVPTHDWLAENGVDFRNDEVVGPQMASTVPRQIRVRPWPNREETYIYVPTRGGSGLVRQLEKRIRESGGQILLQHRMTSIIREQQLSGRVLGITVEHQDTVLNIRALKGVLVATGGHSNNVEFRRIFDPRLTEEYRVSGDPYSRKTGDGEIASMAIGASLWGTSAQTNEAERCIRKSGTIGCEFTESSCPWLPESPIFDEKVRASGLWNIDWANLILVTQDGVRFWDETANDYDFFAAALESRGQPEKRNGGGPIWAIFDSEAVERQVWDPTPPHVDPDGFFFSADTIGELARRIKNEHQPYPMPAAALEETVSRFNGFVDAGVDQDFAKPQPLHKIETPPFYAAWSTPTIHDSYTGLRINTSSQVIDLHGEVIDGLYAAGESHGGFNQHGLGRSMVFGRIAGRHAASS